LSNSQALPDDIAQNRVPPIAIAPAGVAINTHGTMPGPSSAVAGVASVAPAGAASVVGAASSRAPSPVEPSSPRVPPLAAARFFFSVRDAALERCQARFELTAVFYARLGARGTYASEVAALRVSFASR